MSITSEKHLEALGQSEAYLTFQERLSRVAPVERPVLLVGERGTGKELAAHRLHYLSLRWEGSFVTLNCSTLAPTLIESELFGHEKGAYTGADDRRIGRFEAAHGGTLFLDEIGTIPSQAQEKILRVVEYGSFERVGGSEVIEVDVRIVCATNADLVDMAERGEFKRDLLDRLSFEVLYLPPLRCREEDIMLLANHFAARMAYELEIEEDIHFTTQAVKALESYPWSGNVRELKNVIERAVYSSDSGRIDGITFDPFISPYPVLKIDDESGLAANETSGRTLSDSVADKGFKDAVQEFEIRLIKQELEKNRYNQKKTADRLGLSYDQFRGLLRKYRGHID
jgi:psp operon transcriptional activator